MEPYVSEIFERFSIFSVAWKSQWILNFRETTCGKRTLYHIALPMLTLRTKPVDYLKVMRFFSMEMFYWIATLLNFWICKMAVVFFGMWVCCCYTKYMKFYIFVREEILKWNEKTIIFQQVWDIFIHTKSSQVFSTFQFAIRHLGFLNLLRFRRYVCNDFNFKTVSFIARCISNVQNKIIKVKLLYEFKH